MLGLLDDAALVHRLLAAAPGDQAGEEELCRRFGPRIRLYGLRHLRDEDAADDLVQEVLLRVLEAIRARRLTDPSSIASFVLGTCRYVVKNLRRGDARRQRLLAEHATDVLNGGIPSEPEGFLEVIECLATLPARHRAILFRTFYERQDADTIARALGLRAGNVRVIRHRALAHLRQCIAAKGLGRKAMETSGG